MSITLMRRNKPIMLRVLVLILAILVLTMCPLSIFAEAYAVAELAALLPAGAAAPVVLVVAILIAGGAVFNNWSDACKAGVKIWDVIKLDAAVAAEVAGLASPLTTLTSVLGYAIKVSPQLWQRVIGQFKEQFMNGEGVIGSWTEPFTFEYGVLNEVYKAYDIEFNKYDIKQVRVNGDLYKAYLLSPSDGYVHVSKNGKQMAYKTTQHFGISYRIGISYVDYSPTPSLSVMLFSLRDDGIWSGDNFLPQSSSKIPFSISYPLGVSFSGSIAAPSDDYLVKVPDIPNEADSDGKIAVPPYPLNPTDWRVGTADLPDVFGDTTVSDLPADKVIDMSTGKTVEGEIANPDIPGTGTLPAPGDISLPKLIVSKFPFCIPFDLYNMLTMLACDPVEPVFHLPFKIGNRVNEEIVLDFKKFSGIIEILRWGEQIVFIGGLAYVTRNYIKW